MTIYKIYVNDRNYTSWDVFETTQYQKTQLDIIPNNNKLFSNDVFTLDENKNVNIIHSSIRSTNINPWRSYIS